MKINCKDVESKLIELDNLLSQKEPDQNVIDFLDKILLKYRFRKSIITYSDGSNDYNDNVLPKKS